MGQSIQPAHAGERTVWFTHSSDSSPQLHLYFFWSKKCPHCLRAFPDIERFHASYPWIKTHFLELTEHPENIPLYVRMAEELGEQAQSVPAFLFCAHMETGYSDGYDQTLLQMLTHCRNHIERSGGLTGLDFKAWNNSIVQTPLFGDVDPTHYSLPLFTVLLAAMDAFNPCAFFVLLFLLSLMIHARRRSQMLVVGFVFVLCSGFLYFLFMAAWLNVFLMLGQMQAITVSAGVIALFMAAVNIKDFFSFQRGFSLSIPKGAKPGLIARMRGLLEKQSLLAVSAGAVGLALFANFYELLCTAGFPMVYTRVLTLAELNNTHYYLYLLLYNVIYVIPLALIVLVFTLTLGARKLTEQEGRVLKLLSGIMMLSLGLMLLIWPEGLNQFFTAVLLIALSIGVTAVIARTVKFHR